MPLPGACTFQKWEKARGHGFIRFILVCGVLQFGLSSTALFLLLGWLVGKVTLLPELLVRSLVCCVIGGTAWGFLLWMWMEVSYTRHCRTGGACPAGHAPSKFTIRFTLMELVVFLMALALFVTLVFAAPLATCPDCSGTGSRIPGLACLDCGGIGRLSVWARWGLE